MGIRRHSDRLLLDLHATVRSALHREGLVNVPAIALELNDRHTTEAISLSEIEAHVLATALQLKAIVLFQRPAHCHQQPEGRASAHQ